jgi:hypothetical protein
MNNFGRGSYGGGRGSYGGGRGSYGGGGGRGSFGGGGGGDFNPFGGSNYERKNFGGGGFSNNVNKIRVSDNKLKNALEKKVDMKKSIDKIVDDFNENVDDSFYEIALSSTSKKRGRF